MLTVALAIVLAAAIFATAGYSHTLALLIRNRDDDDDTFMMACVMTVLWVVYYVLSHTK